MDGNRTLIVAMHRWISLTTALEAERNWIVTLTIHDHTQTQPIPISEWRGRGGGGVWVAFEWVEGAERELVMVFLYCVDLVLFFVYGIVLDVCLFDFDFSGDYVIELFGKWIATHRLSNCKSPHHDYRGIRFLQWIMVVCSGLTVFNGTYPVHYDCHESTIWVELQQVWLEPWIAKSGKNRSCRCVLQWLWMGVCLNEWDAYHMEREQEVNVDGIKRTMSWWDFNCK